MSGERFYRLLLLLYPSDFRDDFGEEMIELFHYRRRKSNALTLWRLIAADVAVSLPRAWFRRSRAISPRSISTAGLALDLVVALRSLRRSAGSSALATAILAIGAGTSLTVFAALNGVLLRALPYPGAERIVRLWANDAEVDHFSFTKVEFRTYAEENKVFEFVGGDFPLDLTLTGPEGEPERLVAALTTPGYLEVFGAKPHLGRTFTFQDVGTGNSSVAVVSHGLWVRRFGADPGLVGRAMKLDGHNFTVVGVLARGFRHLTTDTDVFIPYTFGTERWIARWLELSAKLKQGVSIEQAEADIDRMSAVLAEEHERTRGWSMSVEPLADSVAGSSRYALWAAFGAVLMLFALAAANVTNLVLARAASRQHEVDLRAALGAGPFERVRQGTVENLFIAVAGLAGGVGLASRLTPHLLDLGMGSLPRLSTFETDHRVVLFGAGIGLTTVLLLGCAPVVFGAVRSRRTTVLTGRAATGISRAIGSLLTGLVVAETALAVAILAGAGLLMRSYIELVRIDPGYDRTGTVAMTVTLPGTRYPERESRIAFFDELCTRLNALPGTASSATAAYLPLGGRGALSFLNSELRVARGEPRVSSLQRIVSPEFFRTLRIPVLQGDTFDRRRPESATGQVVVGAALARQLFGEDDPVGKRVTSSETPGPGDWREVAGVVGDVRYVDLGQAPEAQYYELFDEQAWNTMTVVTRTSAGFETFLGMAREAVYAVDPEVPLFDVETLDEMAGRAFARARLNVAVFTLFSSVAIALAVAGIYGVLSFLTVRRAREIGVRMAFGASREQVLRSFVRRALTLTATGTLLGLSIAGLSFYGLRSLLYGVSPFDPLTAVAVALLLLGAGGLASFLPALRASRVDPMTALRQQ
ncbi:MAG TPA: ABC transporter permease [Vicinamibacteria bacterium]|nr:ABC transporter permease [Vicinamibacteria bacterium]